MAGVESTERKNPEELRSELRGFSYDLGTYLDQDTLYGMAFRRGVAEQTPKFFPEIQQARVEFWGLPQAKTLNMRISDETDPDISTNLTFDSLPISPDGTIENEDATPYVLALAGLVSEISRVKTGLITSSDPGRATSLLALFDRYHRIADANPILTRLYSAFENQIGELREMTEASSEISAQGGTTLSEGHSGFSLPPPINFDDSPEDDIETPAIDFSSLPPLPSSTPRGFSLPPPPEDIPPPAHEDTIDEGDESDIPSSDPFPLLKNPSPPSRFTPPPPPPPFEPERWSALPPREFVKAIDALRGGSSDISSWVGHLAENNYVRQSLEGLQAELERLRSENAELRQGGETRSEATGATESQEDSRFMDALKTVMNGGEVWAGTLARLSPAQLAVVNELQTKQFEQRVKLHSNHSAAQEAIRITLQGGEIPDYIRENLVDSDLELLEQIKSRLSSGEPREQGFRQEENEAKDLSREGDLLEEKERIASTFDNYRYIIEAIANEDDIPQGDIETWDPATRQIFRQLLELRKSKADARRLQIDLAAAEQRANHAEQQVRERGDRPDSQTDLEADTERFHQAIDTLLRTGHVPADILYALTPSDREKMEAIERKLLQEDSQIHGEHIALEQALELTLRGEEVPEEILQKLNGLDSDLLRQVRQRTQPESVPVEQSQLADRHQVNRADAQSLVLAFLQAAEGKFQGFRDPTERQHFFDMVDRVFPGRAQKILEVIEQKQPVHELTSAHDADQEAFRRGEALIEDEQSTVERLRENETLMNLVEALKRGDKGLGNNEPNDEAVLRILTEEYAAHPNMNIIAAVKFIQSQVPRIVRLRLRTPQPPQQEVATQLIRRAFEANAQQSGDSPELQAIQGLLNRIVSPQSES